ncbi:hypothetical protein E3A20_14400 [Planctomyces bekefii]|uniref:Uncharacterized protein n=1 Tax=Planctomyces bekefii TaxID=1653850 RepID=A0A5C6M580_9PLAN|nr:hypothetical protein E3A20_14400 [Planctomyces bekefii]
MIPARGKEPAELWQREDDLINHRLTWLLTSQGLLFAGYGWIFPQPQLSGLAWVVAYLGLISSLLIAAGLVGAVIAQLILRKRHGHKLYIHFVCAIIGWATAVGLAIVFAGGWICVMLAA